MRVVCSLLGDSTHGLLPASGFEERPFLPGGEQNMYELAFAAAALGHDVELRGWIEPRAFERMRAGVGVAPRVEMPARRPLPEDLVIVPEGWQDPLEYLRLLLSPARVAIFVLAAPGLFGWPFSGPGWTRPDPLTVPLDSVARPEHFRAMQATGFALVTHSSGLAAAARDAGVHCSLIGVGRPEMSPGPGDAPRPVDVAVLMANRWRPLAEQVVTGLQGLSVDLIEQTSNDEILRRLARSRTLLWPSRIEGHATIPWEARTVGCVPVALSTNRFAMGLDEESGAIVVDDVVALAPAIRSLIADEARWLQLSRRASARSREDVNWDVYLERVAAFLDALTEDAGAPARATMGEALADSQARADERIIELGAELETVLADRDKTAWERRGYLAELTALRQRRAVRAAFRLDAFRADLHQRLHQPRGSAPTPVDRWNGYLRSVEPALASHPRVHRFAQPPVVADATTVSAPLAVWIDGEDVDGRTREALEGSTCTPTEVLTGRLVDALTGSSTAHVVLASGGDALAPLALERLGQAVTLAPDARVITCDEDIETPDGVRRSPHFRPGPSPDRWLACDDSGSLLVVSRHDALQALRRVGDVPALHHALALELAGPDGAGHAHVPMVLVHHAEARWTPMRNEPETIAGTLSRWEPDARVTSSSGIRRIERRLSVRPDVQVIVCFRDRADLTERCVSSLLDVTDYPSLSVTLVDNGSERAATAQMLVALAKDDRVSVVRDERPFNFAALNNSAVGNCDLLVFLNNDTETIDPDWVTALAEEACRPQVGAVAPMLLYPDGGVQQAGAAIGMHGYAGHPFAGLSPDQQTPFGHAAQGTRNWLAVSAACMMVQRRKFATVGGFDESFVVAGNDVDLCLRLTAAGYRSLCVSHATMIHDESRSRGDHIDPGDFAASERSYGLFRTVGDPFYNPSLSLTRTDCAVRVPGEEA